MNMSKYVFKNLDDLKKPKVKKVKIVRKLNKGYFESEVTKQYKLSNRKFKVFLNLIDSTGITFDLKTKKDHRVVTLTETKKLTNFQQLSEVLKC